MIPLKGILKMKRSQAQQLNLRRKRKKPNQCQHRPKGRNLSIHMESGNRSSKKRIHSKFLIYIEGVQSCLRSVGLIKILTEHWLSLFCSSPVQKWIYSCPRCKETLPAPRWTCRQSPNRNLRNASSPPSEMKGDPLHSGKTSRRTANPGASDRGTVTIDPNQYKRQARMQQNDTFKQMQKLFLGWFWIFHVFFGAFKQIHFFVSPSLQISFCIHILENIGRRNNKTLKLKMSTQSSFLYAEICL